MIFHTHNQTPDIDVNFTSLQGSIEVSYEVLCALLGEPLEGDGRKTDAEWHLISVPDGVVATIYNWKNGRNYLGADGLNVQDITTWHVGGHSQLADELVQKMIKEALEQA